MTSKPAIFTNIRGVSKGILIVIILLIVSPSLYAGARKIVKSANWELMYYNEKADCYEQYYKIGKERKTFKIAKIKGYKQTRISGFLHRGWMIAWALDHNEVEYIIVAGSDGTVYYKRKLKTPYGVIRWKFSNSGDKIAIRQQNSFGIWDLRSDSFRELHKDLPGDRLHWNEDDTKILMYKYSEASPGIYIYDIPQNKLIRILEENQENRNLNTEMYFLNDEEIIYYDRIKRKIWKYNFNTEEKSMFFDCMKSESSKWWLVYYGKVHNFEGLTPDRKYLIGSITKVPLLSFGVEYYGIIAIDLETRKYIILESGKWKFSFVLPKDATPEWVANANICPLISDDNGSGEETTDIERAVTVDTKTISVKAGREPDERVKALIHTAQEYSDTSRETEALSICEEVLSEYPDYTMPYLVQAYCYSDLGDYNRAVVAINKAIDINPNEMLFYYARAQIYEDCELSEEAVKDLSTAIKFSPEVKELYEYRSGLYWSLGKYDEAIADQTKAMELAPGGAGNYVSRGAMYSYAGKYKEAIKDYDLALVLDPYDPEIYFFRAYAYAMSGRRQRSIEDLTEMLRLDPADIKAYLFRGIEYRLIGERDKSHKDLDKVIAHDPKSQFAEIALVLKDKKLKKKDVSINWYWKRKLKGKGSTVMIVGDFPGLTPAQNDLAWEWLMAEMEELTK